MDPLPLVYALDSDGVAGDSSRTTIYINEVGVTQLQAALERLVKDKTEVKFAAYENGHHKWVVLSPSTQADFDCQCK